MGTISYTVASNGLSGFSELSVDGRYVTYESSAHSYNVFDLQSGGTKSLAFDISTHPSVPPSLSRDGQLLAYATYDAGYTFHVWNTATGAVSDVYANHTSAALVQVDDLA